MALNAPPKKRKLKYRDIDLNLSVNPLNNDISTLNENASIQQSVKLLVMTAFYEKWFRPQIGNFIPTALFELPDDDIEDAIQSSVASMLAQYEPRILLENGREDVIIDGLEDDRNEFRVQIKYLIRGQIGENFTDVYVKRTK